MKLDVQKVKVDGLRKRSFFQRPFILIQTADFAQPDLAKDRPFAFNDPLRSSTLEITSLSEPYKQKDMHR